MSDADCTAGREPHSVATSSILFWPNNSSNYSYSPSSNFFLFGTTLLQTSSSFYINHHNTLHPGQSSDTDTVNTFINDTEIKENDHLLRYWKNTNWSLCNVSCASGIIYQPVSHLRYFNQTPSKHRITITALSLHSDSHWRHSSLTSISVL